MLICTAPAATSADPNYARERYGIYTLTDKPGYKPAVGKPLCDSNAEKILDRWRGSFTIKYTDKSITINSEQWLLDGHIPSNAIAHRPPDASIKDRIVLLFWRRANKATGHLMLTDESLKCATAVEFIGTWSHS